MQVCNVLLAARCKYRTQKSRQKSPFGHHPTTLSGYIFATKACIDNRKKNLSSSNISSTCPHNMVNFGPLAAEIVSSVWGTPGNFNGFRVLAALLHGTLVVGVSQTAALNRGRHLYSAGRPSRWALAHISSIKFPAGDAAAPRCPTIGTRLDAAAHTAVYHRGLHVCGRRVGRRVPRYDRRTYAAASPAGNACNQQSASVTRRRRRRLIRRPRENPGAPCLSDVRARSTVIRRPPPPALILF